MTVHTRPLTNDRWGREEGKEVSEMLDGNEFSTKSNTIDPMDLGVGYSSTLF